MKRIHLPIPVLLLLILLVFVSCSSDDATNLQLSKITFGDQTFSLNNANTYLLRDEANATWKYRTYAISDGTYRDDGTNGWNLEDYENATFSLVLEIAIKLGETPQILTTGEYPQWNNWREAAESDDIMISYVRMGTANEIFETQQEAEGNTHPAVIVSGGLNDGENIRLKSEGVMRYEDSENNISFPMFSLTFEGTVIDKIN